MEKTEPTYSVNPMMNERETLKFVFGQLEGLAHTVRYNLEPELKTELKEMVGRISDILEEDDDSN